MHARLPFSCGAVLLILITFLLVPCTRVDAQSLTGLLAQADIQPAGEVESEKANQEAIKKLRRMSPKEIKALDKKLAEALILYYDRKFARALPIFNEIAGKVETMDIMFWIGTSAMQVGETELAIWKFKEMLAIDPKLHRVRLELATTYFTTGRYDEARQELEIVQAAAPPPGVQKNIEKLLAAIEKATQKVSWNLRLSQGIVWDNNISVGPDDRKIPYGAGTLELNKESAKLRDEATVTNFMGNVLYDMGEKNKWMWNTTASFYNLAYFDYRRFNYMAMDVATGPWWAGRRDILKIPFGYTETEYGSDRLSHTYHVDPNYEYYFNQYFSLKGLYSYGDTAYYARENDRLGNNKHRYELTPNFYLENRKYILSATAGYEDCNADDLSQSYDASYYALSCFAGLPANIEFFLKYQWTRREYDDATPAGYDKYRLDKRDTFTAVLSNGFLEYYFASFAFNYTDNRSSCELYEFDRTTYTISVGCRF